MRASKAGAPMIHCVLHDPRDSVAVVAVEGVAAGDLGHREFLLTLL